MKVCSKCGEEKALTEFYIHRTGGKLVRSECKICTAKVNAATKAANPTYFQDYNLLKKYGLTREQYQEILDYQGGVCAICGHPPKKNLLNVDHDHKTGRVRGLLCWRCNHHMLAAAQDDPARLRAAAAYLEVPPAEDVIGVHEVPKRKRKRRKKNG